MWSTWNYDALEGFEEPPPSFGVREPRKPKPPSLSGGAQAKPHFTADAPPPYREVVTGVTQCSSKR